jgi:SAM-dependent methyltransferase
MKIVCRVCSSTLNNPSIYSYSDTYLNYKKSETDYVYCQNCDCLFQYPVISDQELESYYPKVYYTKTSGANKSALALLREYIIRSNIDSHYRPPFPYLIAVYLFREFFSKILPTEYGYNKYFLDFGCGNGDNLRLLAKYGWNCTGVELDEDHIAQLRKEGLNVVALSPTQLETKKYDAIRLWHVLEHLNNPIPTLQELRRSLSVDGVIYCALPNFNSVNRFIFGQYWIGADAPRHVFSFSRKSLKYIFNAAGFKIEYIRTKSSGGFVQSLNNFIKSKTKSKKFNFLIGTFSSILLYPIDLICDVFGVGDIFYIVLTPND